MVKTNKTDSTILYAHGTDRKGIRFTVAIKPVIKLNQTEYKVGITACSPEDQFTRKEGIKYAKKFLEELPFKFAIDGVISSKKLHVHFLHQFVKGRSRESVRKFISKRRNT